MGEFPFFFFCGMQSFSAVLPGHSPPYPHVHTFCNHPRNRLRDLSEGMFSLGQFFSSGLVRVLIGTNFTSENGEKLSVEGDF